MRETGRVLRVLGLSLGVFLLVFLFLLLTILVARMGSRLGLGENLGVFAFFGLLFVGYLWAVTSTWRAEGRVRPLWHHFWKPIALLSFALITFPVWGFVDPETAIGKALWLGASVLGLGVLVFWFRWAKRHGL